MYLQDSDLNYKRGGRLCVEVYNDAQKPWHCPILLYQPDDKACMSWYLGFLSESHRLASSSDAC